MLSCAIVTLNTSPGCLGIMKYVAFGLVEYQCNNETIYLHNHWHQMATALQLEVSTRLN